MLAENTQNWHAAEKNCDICIKFLRFTLNFNKNGLYYNRKAFKGSVSEKVYAGTAGRRARRVHNGKAAHRRQLYGHIFPQRRRGVQYGRRHGGDSALL